MKLQTLKRQGGETILIVEKSMNEENRADGIMWGFWCTEKEAETWPKNEDTICIFKIKTKNK